MRQVIRQNILNRLKEDEALIFEIASYLGKKFRTVYQWILKDSEQLQTPAVVNMIKEKYNLEDSEILEDVSETEAA